MISHFFFFLPYVRLVILQILYKYIFLVYWSTQRTVTRWHCLQNVDFDDDEDDLNMEEEECKSPNALLYYFYLPKSSKLIKKKRIQRTVGMLPDLEFIIYVVLLVFFFFFWWSTAISRWGCLRVMLRGTWIRECWPSNLIMDAWDELSLKWARGFNGFAYVYIKLFHFDWGLFCNPPSFWEQPILPY